MEGIKGIWNAANFDFSDRYFQELTSRFAEDTRLIFPYNYNDKALTEARDQSEGRDTLLKGMIEKIFSSEAANTSNAVVVWFVCKALHEPDTTKLYMKDG